MSSEFSKSNVVLIVDDNPTNLAVLSDVLDHAGLEVLVAQDGESRGFPAAPGGFTGLFDVAFASPIEGDVEIGWRLARAACKPMMKARFGRIISVTSVVGVTGNPGQANYAASKAGLIGMSKALAQELASRQITVNCIAPGFIASPMTEALAEAQKTALLARIPAGRLSEGREIAAGVVYLASREAAYVTGQTLHVNGGMAMP